MKITAIGGGTGTVSVLRGLKKFSDIDINVIVSMTDDGGSNEVVRDEFGILPLSDLRKSIIALSKDNENEMLQELFTYRFAEGIGIEGHTLGNLIMIALTKIAGSEMAAIKLASEIFDVEGNIIPVTLDDVRLVAEYADGSKVVGEHLIDDSKNEQRIEKFYSKPKAKVSKEARMSIMQSDYVVIGPGDLYTSILANIIVDGVPEALNDTKAKIIYVSNLMSKVGETRGMKHSDFVSEIERYCKRKIDYLFINTAAYSKEILKRYKTDGESPVEDDLINKQPHYKIIRDDLVSMEIVNKAKGDKLKRSFIRHDSEKLGGAIYSLVRKPFYREISRLLFK